MFVDQHAVNLAEANRIATQPLDDRLNGLQGEEASKVAANLLEEAGMVYIDAVRLLSVIGWQNWKAGWEAGATSKKDS